MRKILILLIPAITLMSSCVRESPLHRSQEGKEIELRFSTASAATRAANTDETIQSVDILVFDGQGVDTDNAVFLYSRYAWRKSSGLYSAILKLGQNLDIYFAINASGVIADKLTEGMTWAQIRPLLVMENPSQTGLVNGLPMWGCKLDQTISESVSASMGTIQLLRAVASADVRVTASNFTLDKGHIVYASDKGLLAYTPSNTTIDGEGNIRITAPEMPAGTTAATEWSRSASGTQQIVDVFYMYENDAPANGKRYTKMILEGKWSGSSVTDNTFYPIAFRNAATNNRLTLKRNMKFIVIISNVNGDGYPDLESAKSGEDVNMDYDVIEWDHYEDGDIMIDGSKYFSIPSKSATLSRNAGATAELKFSTNYALSDILMKLNQADEGTAGLLDAHARFRIETVTKNDPGGNPYTCFLITAKQDYGTSGNPASVTITAGGRIMFNLTLTQRDGSNEDWESGGNTDTDFGKQ